MEVVVNEYREKVRRLARERSGEPFFNASEDHAAIIVENMFRLADSDVSIFTSHLAPRIYARDHCVEWARIFLSDDTDHRLRIICKEGELKALKANPFFNAVRASRGLHVRALDDDAHSQIAQRFMVADEDCFRFEPDHSKCQAVAAFGSAELTSDLRRAFSGLWEASKPVNVDNLETMHPELAM